ELRARGAELLPGVESTPPVDRTAALADLEAALYAAKICAYAQGFALLAAAEKNYGWKLNYGGIA
ncbi:MAG TPA: phosphogluconate dehydrogenase (NADP(+)-dependent, decarboxylating), partial [Lentisphaeria bacterium]|nr:phosphogluconate dehydrogenase (NADP(+)-dependent, decarboxylating) [Lentisphaeria bacterium]